MVQADPNVVVVVAGLFGLAAGSFLNVLILRTHKAESPWRGRSHCPTCGHELPWYDLLPIVSFAWLRGRCRHCRTALSWQYPLVEAITAALFIIIALQFHLTWLTLLGWLVSACLIAIAVYDARWALLPDGFTLALAITGAGFALAAATNLVDMLYGLIGGALFFAAQYTLSRGRWVGSGDVLLGAALGLMLGWRMLALALLLAYLIGALAASVLLLSRRRTMAATIPFGPYLVLGSFVAWLWGPSIVDWYFTHALFR